MNMYNADHIANTQAYRDGYDLINWNKGEYTDTAEEHVCCGECSGDCKAGESGDTWLEHSKKKGLWDFP